MLWPHGPQHAKRLCPSLSPGVCSNSCPLSPYCHPAISSSVGSFSCSLLSFPSSGSFLMRQLSTSDSQSIGDSASVLPMSIQGWFPFRLTGLISLLSKGLSRLFSSTSVWKHQFFSALYGPTLTSVHDYWKNHSFDYTDLCRASDVHILTLQKKKPACIEDPFNEKKIL